MADADGRPVTTTPAEMAVVNEAIHLANAEAAVRLAHTGAPVSSIFGLSPIVPQDDDPATASMAQALVRLLLGPVGPALPGRSPASARAGTRSSGRTSSASST